MLDKYKARFAKFEEDHEKVRQIHAHLVKHQTKYLIGGASISASTVTFVLTRRFSAPDVIQSFSNSNDNIATVVNRSKNVDVIIRYVNQRGYIANPVICLETGEKWPSQVEAAFAKGISETNLSQHLNGKYPHANGLHFARLS